eukprot:6201840-Pleurochrysis_carterae.AAC.2
MRAIITSRPSPLQFNVSSGGRIRNQAVFCKHCSAAKHCFDTAKQARVPDEHALLGNEGCNVLTNGFASALRACDVRRGGVDRMDWVLARCAARVSRTPSAPRCDQDPPIWTTRLQGGEAAGILSARAM